MPDSMAEPILVSSCLLGLPTRYDGKSKTTPQLLNYLRQNNLTPIPVCPEQLGGLPTPRPKSRFTRGDGLAVLQGQGRICNEKHQIVSDIFLHGARQTLAIARLCGCRRAILKERSPSCGTRQIYLEDHAVPGMGVTAALLKQAGLEIQSEETLFEP